MGEMTTTSAICARCPVALTDEVLTGQAVALLSPVRIRHIGPTRRARGEALAIVKGVFAALPECRGLCFHCALECADPPPSSAAVEGELPEPRAGGCRRVATFLAACAARRIRYGWKSAAEIRAEVDAEFAAGERAAGGDDG
jgi:hypothetical protein